MRLWALLGLIMVAFAWHVSAVAENSKKSVYFMGGVYDPKKQPAIFDSVLDSFQFMLRRNSDWSPHVVYGGLAPLSDAKAKKKFGNLVNPMTDAQTFHQWDEIANQAQPGDQVLLIVNDHGAKKKPFETTHSVNAITSSGDIMQVGLDSLIPLRDELEAKGVRFAILDLSCHSGNSLRLATSKTCVISMSHAVLEGTNNFANQLFLHFKAGRSLEAAFESSRNSKNRMVGNYQLEMPEISSPAGKRVAAWLEPIVPYMVADYLPHHSQADMIEMTESDVTQKLMRLRNEPCLTAHEDQQIEAMASQFQQIASRIDDSEQWPALLKPVYQWLSTDGKRKDFQNIVGKLVERLKNYRQAFNQTHDAFEKAMKSSSEFNSYFLSSDEARNRNLAYGITGVAEPQWIHATPDVQAYMLQLSKLSQAAIAVNESENRLVRYLYEQAHEDPRLAQEPDPCADFRL